MILPHLVLFSFFTGATASGAVAPPAQTSEYRLHGVAMPPESPGPAPRVGSLHGIEADRDFYALAKLAEIDIYLKEVAEFLDGDGEIADLNEDPFRPDDELIGPATRPTRMRRR